MNDDKFREELVVRCEFIIVRQVYQLLDGVCDFIYISRSSFKLIFKFNLNKFSLHIQVEKLGKDSFVNCAKTSMSSKLIGGDSDFFANLVSY